MTRFRNASDRALTAFRRMLGIQSRPRPAYHPRHDGTQDLVGPEYDPRPWIEKFAEVITDDRIQPGTAYIMPRKNGKWTITNEVNRVRAVRAADDTMTAEIPVYPGPAWYSNSSLSPMPDRSDFLQVWMAPS